MNMRTLCLFVGIATVLAFRLFPADTETVFQFYEWSGKVPSTEIKKREDLLRILLNKNPKDGLEVLSKFAETDLLTIEKTYSTRILNQDELNSLAAIEVFVESCSTIKSSEYLDVFTALIENSKSSFMRRFCCRALANYDPNESSKGLMAAMKDKDPIVRCDAILALIKFEKFALILRNPVHFKDADIHIKYALVVASCKESRADAPANPFTSKSIAEYNKSVKSLEILFAKLKMKALEFPGF